MDVLLLPAWMTSLELYQPRRENLQVVIGRLDAQSLKADMVIGLSLGALAALRQANEISGKIILINPPLPKRSLVIWFARWVRFLAHDGLFMDRQKFTRNPFTYAAAWIDAVRLLGTDFSEAFEHVKDRVIVIRGKGDSYFCDAEAIIFLF